MLYVKSTADAPFVESAPAKSGVFDIKEAGAEPELVTDILTASNFNATNTEYKDFSEVSITSNAVYAGNSAKNSAGAIQLRSSKSTSGIVTTSSGGKVKAIKVTYESGSNTLDVYGKSSDLYSSTKSVQGTKIGTISGSGSINLLAGDYEFIGFRSKSGALYITSIEITYEK